MGTFTAIIMLLLWIVMGVLNFWVFQKGKHQGNLLMLLGSAIFAFFFFVLLITKMPSAFLLYWVPMIGMAIFVLGFFLSVQPMVQAQIDAIKSKVHELTDRKDEGTTDEADKGADAQS